MSNEDFEFERRFYVKHFPSLEVGSPSLIYQIYYFVSEQGYSIRIRLNGREARRGFSELEDLGTAALPELGRTAGVFDSCWLTLKGPMVVGTRYEAERELDISVGLDMAALSDLRVIKLRYHMVFEGDLWSIDRFGGENLPLVLAECERSEPVTDLAIPDFCTTEVTSDPRFSNASLAQRPFGDWVTEFEAELMREGAQFEQGMGRNRFESD